MKEAPHFFNLLWCTMWPTTDSPSNVVHETCLNSDRLVLKFSPHFSLVAIRTRRLFFEQQVAYAHAGGFHSGLLYNVVNDLFSCCGYRKHGSQCEVFTARAGRTREHATGSDLILASGLIDRSVVRNFLWNMLYLILLLHYTRRVQERNLNAIHIVEFGLACKKTVTTHILGCVNPHRPFTGSSSFMAGTPQ